MSSNAHGEDKGASGSGANTAPAPKLRNAAQYQLWRAAIQEVQWIRGMLAELGLPSAKASVVHGDNQSTLAVSKNGIKGERTKHVDVKYHFVTDCIDEGAVQLKWIPTREQQADIFTKALDVQTFTGFRAQLMSH